MGVPGIPVCNECGASAEDGHMQGCPLKGVRPIDILKKVNVKKI